MATSFQPAPEQPLPPRNDETRELLRFLREENHANRTAVRDDAEANRKLLLDTVKIVSIPVSILIALAAFFGFKSISDLKQTIQSEARRETQTEIVRMQGVVRQRLDDQFQAPALQKMVRDAASEYGKSAAEPLIKNEVATQVKARVNAERPMIADAVAQQTQTAVKQMGSQIDSIVKGTVDTKVTSQVGPLVRQVSEIKGQADLELMILRMNADDGEAFDILMSQQASLNPTQQALVVPALRSVIDAHNNGIFMTRQFNQAMTDEQVLAQLDSNLPGNRQAALDTISAKKQPNLLPRIVKIIGSDPSLSVRASAHRIFNTWTEQKFQMLDKADVLRWWEANKAKFTDH